MLREFLYVDITRVRSLLGQLDEGVVENIIQKSERVKNGQVGFTWSPFQAVAGSGRSDSAEESRSVQDLTFALFEEAAQSEGIIRSVDSSEIDSPAAWDDASIHGRFAEGEIIQITSPISIIDPEFVRGRMDRFVSMYKGIAEIEANKKREAIAGLEQAAMAEIEATPVSGGRDRQSTERRKASGKLKREIEDLNAKINAELTDIDKQISPVMTMLSYFLPPDSIAVRFPTCGTDRNDLGFSGSLLGRAEYIQLERDALFSRYGSSLRGWTSVLQIASIPAEPSEGASSEISLPTLDFEGASKISRIAMEQAVMAMLGMLEAKGLAEGPAWPQISVIPLGIYRVVPRSLGNLG